MKNQKKSQKPSLLNKKRKIESSSPIVNKKILDPIHYDKNETNRKSKQTNTIASSLKGNIKITNLFSKFNSGNKSQTFKDHKNPIKKGEYVGNNFSNQYIGTSNAIEAKNSESVIINGDSNNINVILINKKNLKLNSSPYFIPGQNEKKKMKNIENPINTPKIGEIKSNNLLKYFNKVNNKDYKGKEIDNIIIDIEVDSYNEGNDINNIGENLKETLIKEPPTKSNFKKKNNEKKNYLDINDELKGIQSKNFYADKSILNYSKEKNIGHKILNNKCLDLSISLNPSLNETLKVKNNSANDNAQGKSEKKLNKEQLKECNDLLEPLNETINHVINENFIQNKSAIGLDTTLCSRNAEIDKFKNIFEEYYSFDKNKSNLNNREHNHNRGIIQDIVEINKYIELNNRFVYIPSLSFISNNLEPLANNLAPFVKIKKLSENYSCNFLKSKNYRCGFDLIFENYDFEKSYVCDFVDLSNYLIAATIFLNQKLEKVVISIIVFKKFIDKNKNNSCQGFSLEKLQEDNIIYLNIGKENLFHFNIKLVENTSLFLVSINEENYLFYYNINYFNQNSTIEKSTPQSVENLQSKATSNILLIENFKVRNHLNKVDFYIKNEKELEIIIADYDFKILNYRLSINTEIFEEMKKAPWNFFKANDHNIFLFDIHLISLYEKFFYSKITDLKFLNLEELSETSTIKTEKTHITTGNPKLSTKNYKTKANIKNPNIEKNLPSHKDTLDKRIENHQNQYCKSLPQKTLYFGVCSNDGNFRIFTLSSNSKEIFKYKSSELWITSIEYNLQNSIIFLTVNTNEKIVAIKFFPDREYLIKRIPMSDNAIKCFYSSFDDNLYLLDDFSNIKLIKCSHFQSLFKNYKTRCRKSYTAEKIFESISNISEKENKKTLNQKNYENAPNNSTNLDVKTNWDDKKYFMLNDEIIINENEDKIFSFKVLQMNKYDINKIREENVFAINRINRASLYY